MLHPVWIECVRVAFLTLFKKLRPLKVRCYVAEMKTSAGSDFYVCISVNDGRYMTPHKYRERWKADFDVAEWNALFNNTPKPDLFEYMPLSEEADNG